MRTCESHGRHVPLHPVASPLRPCLCPPLPFFSSLLLSLWRAQFITGSLLNFGAFTFASASILVPIEAVQFVVNVGFNKLVNEKPISCRMLSGVTLTICGTVLCVVFGPTDERCFGVNDLVQFWTKPLWWVYLVASLGLATAAHMVHESYARAVASGHRPKYAVYVMPISFSVSSALFGGSQMIVHSKAVAELFELQVQMVEPIPLAHWFFWLELVLLSTTGIYWMLRMNTSLGLYDPLFIIPLLQSSYILFGVISGGIYFEEFAGLHNGPAGAGAWPLFIFGMIGVLSGLALIAPPPSEAGLPTTAAPGPKLREHRISREDLEGGCGSAAASSSTRKPSASPRARTSPCASFVRHGETYEAACTDSAGGTSGIALSRLPESRTPLSPRHYGAEDDDPSIESAVEDSTHGGSRCSPSRNSEDEELEAVRDTGEDSAGTRGAGLSGRLGTLTKAVGTVSSAAVHTAAGAVGAVGSAVGSAVGGTRQCGAHRPPPLAASEHRGSPTGLSTEEVAITLNEGADAGIDLVLEDQEGSADGARAGTPEASDAVGPKEGESSPLRKPT